MNNKKGLFYEELDSTWLRHCPQLLAKETNSNV